MQHLHCFYYHLLQLLLYLLELKYMHQNKLTDMFYYFLSTLLFVVLIFCSSTVYDIPFFVANLDFSLLELYSKFVFLCVSILYNINNFLWKTKSCFFYFPVMKNIVAPSFLSSLPIKLIFCIISASSNSILLS